MTSESHPSFSPARKWSLSLNTALSLVAVFALTLMVNYLAARHFKRWSISSRSQVELSELTLRVLGAVTNDVKVTLYFSKREPLYEMTRDLLKTYKLSNNRISVDLVDYERDNSEAQLVKARYQLNDATDRDMVIFECQGRKKYVYQSELSELDLEPLMKGESREVKRTAFKGEPLFTSAILNVIIPRPLKAYFLQGHGEHDPAATDKAGYAQFVRVLDENNIQSAKLSLRGSSGIPPDCNLLIIAGPRSALMPDVLEKIDRYLNQGGRLLVLFNVGSVLQSTGLEDALANWGVEIGNNVIIDEKNADKEDDKSALSSFVVSTYGTHPLIKPLHNGYQLYLVLPRSVGKSPSAARGSDAPQVEPLFYSSEGGRIITDIRPGGVINPRITDVITNVPLAVAVEKGGIRNVSADRGATRIVVIGESLFLSNSAIGRVANQQLISHAVNWLLARNDLLVAVPPRPIKEFKLTMTRSQLKTAQWLLLAAFPGSVLFLGWLVWLKRRR